MEHHFPKPKRRANKGAGAFRAFARRLRRAALALLGRISVPFGVRSLAALVGVILMGVVYLAQLQPNGVFIACDCSTRVQTEERVARHLQALMNEIDETTNRTALEASEAWHPSLAVKFLAEQDNRSSRCQETPGLFSIRHSNLVWQEATVSGTPFLLYGAYYDDRDAEEGPLVRLLAMVMSKWPPTPTCHLWFEGHEAPMATRAIRMDYIHWQERLSGHWLPFLVTCRSGEDLKRGPPQVVSLTGQACEPSTNALRVLRQGHGKEAEEKGKKGKEAEEKGKKGKEAAEEKGKEAEEKKKDLVLCHKFLFNRARDDSKRLVEWLEVARAWGVDHVMLYEASVHPKVERVLRYYEAEGFVTVKPWTSPGAQPSVPFLFRAFYDTQRYSLFTDENVPYTDCLLRHVSTHRYVAVWDVDEFLLPVRHSSIAAMVDEARRRALLEGRPRPTSYVARASYFFSRASEPPSGALPAHAHALRHVTRSRRAAPPLVFAKAVHDAARALGLHAHYALLNLRGPVDRGRDLYALRPRRDALLAHYRSTCQGEDHSSCAALFEPFLVRDTTIWRHRRTVLNATAAVLSRLGLL